MEFKNINPDVVNYAMSRTEAVSINFEPSVFLISSLNEGGAVLDLGHIKN